MAVEADYIDESLNTFLGLPHIQEFPGPWIFLAAMHAQITLAGTRHLSSFTYEAVTGDDNPNTHSANDTATVDGSFCRICEDWCRVCLRNGYLISLN